MIGIELRKPAQRPALPRSVAGLRTFPSACDAYVNDHFGFRSPLVRLNSLTRLALGASGSREVLIGREGWLFLDRNHSALLQYRGISRFSPEELNQWVFSMQSRAAALAARGIPLYLLVAPSKHSVYPQYLPGWSTPVGARRVEQIASLTNRLDNTELIYPMRQLQEALTSAGVYAKTDTHWNAVGAFVTYCAVLDRVRKRFPQVAANDLDDYDRDECVSAGGDLARLLALDDWLREIRPVLRPKVTSPVSSVTKGVIEGHSVTQSRADVDNQLKVLLVGDSFLMGADLRVRFEETFADCTFARDRGVELFGEELVDAVEPDLVIWEIAERRLDIMPTPWESDGISKHVLSRSPLTRADPEDSMYRYGN